MNSSVYEKARFSSKNDKDNGDVPLKKKLFANIRKPVKSYSNVMRITESPVSDV